MDSTASLNGINCVFTLTNFHSIDLTTSLQGVSVVSEDVCVCVCVCVGGGGGGGGSTTHFCVSFLLSIQPLCRLLHCPPSAYPSGVVFVLGLYKYDT